MKKVRIYWLNREKAKASLICAKFGMFDEMSINGETECTIRDEDWELFLETARRGFFVIRKMV